MKKRTSLSASLRWQVFARDGFRCRYCGSQAGEPGVTLHADHVVSVRDGGTNAMDNLVTACQACNGGKGARSLGNTPGSAVAVAHAESNAATLQQQADAIAAGIEARKTLRQEVINLLCDAYRVESMSMSERTLSHFVGIVQKHGPELLADWLSQAVRRGVKSHVCIKYVYGIIRTIRQEQEGADE